MRQMGDAASILLDTAWNVLTFKLLFVFLLLGVFLFYKVLGSRPKA